MPRGLPPRPRRGAVVIPFPQRDLANSGRSAEAARSPRRGVVMSARTSRRLGRSTAFECLDPAAAFQLAPDITAPGRIEFSAAVDLILADWHRQNAKQGIADLTLDRQTRFLKQFLQYATTAGVVELADVTPRLCQAFITAPIAGTSPSTKNKAGKAPSGGIQRGRLNAVRVLFMTARLLGLDDRDPTAGMKYARHIRSDLRPLTPAEARTLIDVASSSKGTKWATSLALAMAGSGITEIAYVTIGDIDLANATVLLYGRGQRLQGRRNHLDAWSMNQIARRLKELRRAGHTDPTWPLVLPRPAETYPPNHVSPQASRPFYTLFDRANFSGCGIRPTSISEYAANRAYALTNDIEQVSSLMGLASLDSARSLISDSWQSQWAEQVRLEAGNQ